MRITEKMVHRRLTNSIQQAKDRLTRSQERIATNKNIRRPSDDPVKFMQLMSYHRELYKLEQTSRNAQSASIMLSHTEAVLESVGELLLDLKDKASAMANDTASASDRQAILAEVELIIMDMVQKANTEFSDRYIFAGHKISAPPYVKQGVVKDSTVSLSGGGPVDLGYSLLSGADVTINVYDGTGALVRSIDAGAQVAGDNTYSWDGLDDLGALAPDGRYNYQVSADFGDLIEYVGDQKLIEQMVERNSTMAINIPGSDIFGTSSSGIFQVVENFRRSLDENDTDGIQASITALSVEITRVTEARGNIGMRIRRTDASMDELQLVKSMISQSLSDIEDVDIATEAGEYMATQTSYQAILQSSSSTLRLPTLLDYMG